MGQINPSVRLYVVTLDGSSITTELKPPDSFEKRYFLNTISKLTITFYWSMLTLLVICLPLFIFDFTSEYYMTMVKWVTQERLSVRWVNRAQNMSILSLCDVTTGDCAKVTNILSSPKISSKCTVNKLLGLTWFFQFRNMWWRQRSGLIVR